MILKLMKIRLSGLIFSAIAGKPKKGVQSNVSKGKILLFTFIYLYLAAFIIGFAAFMANSYAALLVTYGFSQVYFGLFITVTFTLVFILSIFETKATLYESRDNELLLSMPIPPKDIIISRISTVLLYNYLETACIMVPVIVIYCIYGGTAVGIIGGIIVSLFVPLFATALSSGVGYLVALISRKFKKNTFVTVVLSLGFMAAYFIGYNYVLNGILGLADVSPEIAETLAENLGIFGVIGTAALLNPLPLAVLIALSVISSAVAYILISKNYISIITKKTAGKKVLYKAQKLEKKSVLLALTAKEFRAFFSSANYILNAGLGAVFEIAVAVIVLINKAEIMTFIGELVFVFPEFAADIDGMVAILAAAFLFAVSTMNFIAAPALSLEGKNLWILKSLPLSGREVLLAKTFPHIIIATAVSVVSSVIMIFALDISPVWWAFVILIPLCGAFLGAFLCAAVGAALPKFDYVSDVQVIKQSAAAGVSMISSMLVGIGSVIGVFGLLTVMPALPAGLLILIVMILLTLLIALLLFGVLAKKFERI